MFIQIIQHSFIKQLLWRHSSLLGAGGSTLEGRVSKVCNEKGCFGVPHCHRANQTVRLESVLKTRDDRTDQTFHSHI